ncbi:MAG: cyclic pyranopterin monophosphate synthase MoaC [Treponema sp.]|nr:cyclic pyranopterin monophosphate synthase MoaC [Treponema sp.]
MEKLTHVNERGEAVMVDISQKAVTERFACASGEIHMKKEAFDAICSMTAPKGDVLGTARIAGIMAAKKTPELIPLCHTLLLSSVTIDFEPIAEESVIRCVCKVSLSGKTGAEMEALTGVSVALLTVYDMCKAIDKGMKITNIALKEKSGGKSGHYIAS